MKIASLTACLMLGMAATSCTDDPSAGGGDGGAGGSASTSNASTSSGASTGGGGGTACTEGLSSVTVAVNQGSISPNAVYSAVRPDGGLVIAWSDGASVWLTELDTQGNRMGQDQQANGQHVHGLSVDATNAALLVAQGTDELHFLKMDANGQTLADVMLVGNSNHNTIGSEWYDYQPTFAAEGGRLHTSGSGYAAYFPIFRRWPDNIAHTGDTLRYLDANGNAQGNGWDWGCSHSLDVRLAESGSTLGPICLSDCYAQKAILFEDNQVISSEPSGNCAGSSNARLGGLVATSDGFWLSYASPEGRMSRDIAVVQVGLNGAPGKRVWLTADNADDDAAHLIAFGQGLLAGWRSGMSYYLAHLDATGELMGSPKTINGSFRALDDFFKYPNGDVGWVDVKGSDLVVYRYGGCTAP